MEWQDIGYVIGLNNHGENDRIVTVITRDQGRQRGYLRGARGRSHRANWQLGNLLNLQWRARLESQLGHFTGEIMEQNAAQWLGDRLRLTLMVAGCELICRYTPERDPTSSIFQAFTDLLRQLQNADKYHCWVAYLRFEYSFIAHLGYGFDINLSMQNFIEHESRAQSSDSIQNSASPNWQNIQDGLILSGKYLDRIEQGGSYAAFTAKPMARHRLLDLIARQQELT